MASGGRVCPLCAARNVRSPLKLYQINEQEAVYMCCKKDVGVASYEFIVIPFPVSVPSWCV